MPIIHPLLLVNLAKTRGRIGPTYGPDFHPIYGVTSFDVALGKTATLYANETPYQNESWDIIKDGCGSKTTIIKREDKSQSFAWNVYFDITPHSKGSCNLTLQRNTNTSNPPMNKIIRVNVV